MSLWNGNRRNTWRRKRTTRNIHKNHRQRAVAGAETLEARQLLAGDLVAHWVADDLNSTVGADNVASEWIDQVAGIKALASGAPTLVPNAESGRSVVRFNPSDGDDYFQVIPNDSPMTGATDYSIVVAFRTSSQNLQGQTTKWYDNTGLVDGNALGFSEDWGVSINSAGQVASGLGSGFLTPVATVYSNTSGHNDGQLHVAVVTKSGANLAVQVDNLAPTSIANASTKPRSSQGIAIGALQGGLKPLEGDIAQVRIYNGALDSSEVAALLTEIDGYYNNAPPVAQNDTYTLQEDGGFFQVTAPNGVLKNDSDPDGDTLTASVVQTTSHGSLALSPNGSFLYAPNPDYFGTDSFTYTANDFRPGNVATVTLTIQPTYDAPRAVADRYEVLPGKVTQIPAIIGVLANDLNPDKGPITAQLVQNAGQGNVTLNADGSFEYNPGAFFGTTTFRYRTTDGTTPSAPVDVTLVVNSAPVANNDTYVVNEDQQLSVAALQGVLANDTDAESNPLTVTLLSSTTNGALQIQPDGSFDYTPAADFFGEDQFTYNLSDGLLTSGTATVRITINSVNDTPQSQTDGYVVPIGETLVVPAESGVLANDTDIDGPGRTAIAVGLPSKGTLDLQPDGSFTFTPNAGARGVDTFSYRYSDGIDSTEATAVTIVMDAGASGTSDPTGDSIVTFNEIMYNPPGATDDQLEWIELRNQMGINMDISNWRLSGGVSFAFPEGTVIPGNGFLVVAINPTALAEASGFAGALGPYIGRLDNAGEDIELRNNSNRIMDVIDYNDRREWPVAPDGTGATLAKRRVHTASGDAANWASSIIVGGTPGADNFADQGLLLPAVLFNEIGGSSDASFAVELINVSNQTVNLEGYAIGTSGTGNPYKIPAGQSLAPGAMRTYTSEQLGFRPAQGDRVILSSPDGKQVLDAQSVVERARGRSSAHDNRWLYTTQATPNAPNQFVIEDSVVINEIMYHAAGIYVSQLDQLFENPEEWVELYNRSQTKTVDLSGWQLSDAVEFVFPEGTQLAPNSYLLVSNDPASLLASRSHLQASQVLGPFSRSLSNGGEPLRLLDRVGNPADEVLYYDSGRWTSDADASGASLELRNPLADNASPEAWAASDESNRVGWQTITYTGTGRVENGDPQQYNEFLLGLLDEGEVLIDDISVIESPGTVDARQLIQNGSFTADAIGAEPAKWRIIGTQHGRVEVDPTNAGNQVLRLTATGPTEHMHNNAGTTLKSGEEFVRLNRNSTYEISFRAKWVSGSNQLYSRLYFNRMPLDVRLDRPSQGGTPGLQNSQFESNIGPTYEGLIHSPAVPAVNQAVTVSVAAADAQGVQSMKLWYSVAAGAFASLPMTLGADGRYAAQIPGQAASTLVQFYVEGTDGAGAVSMFPAAGPESRALYRTQDGRAMNDQRHNLRIVMTDADATALHDQYNVMSNNRLGSTVIYQENEIFYDVGVRLKGSERGRNQQVRVGFNLEFDPLQLFRGVHRTIGVDRSGTGNEYSQEEIIVRQIINHAGNLPQIYDDLIHVIAPQNRHTGSAMLNMARYNDIFLDSQFENGSRGTAYEYELIYYPTSTSGGVEGLKRPEPDSVVGVPLRNIGDHKNLYRWHWLIKNNRRQDNFSQLMAALTAFGGRSSDPGFHDQVEALIDADQWLRSYAVQNVAGIGDNYATGSQHNAIFYVRPSDQRLLYFPWDMDFSFTQGATSSVVGQADIRKLTAKPEHEHNYFGHVWDILNTTFNSDYINPWIDHFTSLVPGQNYSGFKSYISQRNAAITREVERAVPRVAFEITTGDTLDVGASLTATIDGTGWVDVRTIRLAGQQAALPVSWVTDNQWQIEVPVDPGTHDVVLEAYDFQGKLVATDTISVTSSAVTPVRDYLRISELQFNPADPVQGEPDLDNDEFEFVEVMNVGPVALQLNGAYFAQVPIDGDDHGIRFTFGEQSLAPGGRLIVPANREAFVSRYGDTLPLAVGVGDPDSVNAYSGQLDNGGETLTLFDVSGGVVHQFTYDDNWYPITDGDGFSLEFKDPRAADLDAWNNKDNWEPSGPRGGTPGKAIAIAGDANLDGVFNSSDFIAVFLAGEYEDDILGNSTWAEGDWDRDGDFTSSDFIAAFLTGAYEAQAATRAALIDQVFGSNELWGADFTTKFTKSTKGGGRLLRGLGAFLG